MRFQLGTTLNGFSLPQRDEPIHFVVPDSHETVVTIRPRSEEEEIRTPLLFGSHAEAETEFQPKASIAAALAALEAKQLPKDSLPREKWPREFDFIGKDGELMDGHIAPGTILSVSLQDFFSQTQRELAFAVRYVFGILRWRMGHPVALNPFAFQQAFWSSDDGESWHRFPRRTGGRVIARGDSRITPEIADDVQSLVFEVTPEPLAHELWREAWAQRRTSPRSAMLIGMASLEVGIKQFAARHIPDAEWLLAESPTPNVVRMLSEFLPGLVPLENGVPFDPPDAGTLATIRKGVTIRNEVTHKGVKEVKPATVRGVLVAVRKLLWQLDRASGQQWSESLLTETD
jgi:hypothetical protein